MAKKGNTKFRVKMDKEQLSQVITALVYIVIGLLFCIFQGGVLGWLAFVLGAFLIGKGVIDLLVTKAKVLALIEMGLGVLTIVFGVLLVQIIAIIIGIMIIVYGVSALLSQTKNIMSFIINGLIVLAGLLLVFNPGGAIGWLFIVIGVVFIVDGGIALYKALK